jgi:YHS domain-containing protein
MGDFRIESLLLLPLLVTIIVVVMTVGNRQAGSSAGSIHTQASLAETSSSLRTKTPAVSVVSVVPDSTVSNSVVAVSSSPPDSPVSSSVTAVASSPVSGSAFTASGHVSQKATATGDDDSCPSCPANVLEAACSSAGGVVMGGLDFVQYFTTFKNSDGTYDEGKVGTVGSSEYLSTYRGFTYYFMSEANQALFEADPTLYIPQWGGFCSWGISGETCPEYAWSADCLGPDGNWAAWTVYENKLYFFKDASPKSKFLADPVTYSAAGNERWSSWFSDPYSKMSTDCYEKSY